MKWISTGIILLLSLLPACSRNPDTAGPSFVAGIETPNSGIEARDYGEVLKLWRSKGFRNRTVINFSPFDGLAALPMEKIAEIRAGEYGNGITGRNFLHAAAQTGMVKTVYWVMPYEYIEFIDAEMRVRQILGAPERDAGPEDVNSMKFRNGCVSGRYAGVDLHVCSPSSLPAISGHVAIALTDDFFPYFASGKRKNILGVMKMFVDSMALRKLRTDSLQIVPSGGAARQGYIYEELVEIFREPDLINRPVPPELWRLRDSADNMLTGGGAKEVLELLKTQGSSYGKDPYLLLMKATAEFMLGMEAEGFNTLSGRCPDDRLYCRGLVDAGLILKDRGKNDEAEKIFAKVLQVDPGNTRARSAHDELKKSSAVK